MQPWPSSDRQTDAMEVWGTVHDVLPNAMFRVVLDNGHKVLACVGGAMRHHHMRIVSGDRVTVDVSSYDLRRGEITYRMK